MWHSAVETQEMLAGVDNPEVLDDLFALREFWLSLVYPVNYRASPRWPELLAFTEAGQVCLNDLGDVIENFDKPDFYLALFGYFFHHELIFDWSNCDINGICDLLDKELLENKCRLPHRFGRYLYDRFNDMATLDRTDHLLPEKVDELLQDSPQGVYQCLNFVSGPLGLLRSQDIRFVPPALKIPLWHCSDTGCDALHRVSLRPPSIPLVEAYEKIAHFFDHTLGPAAEWSRSLARRHRESMPDRFRQGRRYFDLPALLSECLIGSEMTTLVSRALRSQHSTTFRDIIKSRSAATETGSPEDVARRLNPVEQLQLLLLLPDVELVQMIDEATALQRIKIPIGEIRRSRQSPPSSGGDSRSELSQFGLRSIRENPWASLIGTICRAYSSQNLWDDLEWRLRTAPGVSAKEQLCELARKNGPSWVVQELVFKSKPITQFFCEQCDLCVDEVLRAEAPPIERLLWKLGFNPVAFDHGITRLMDRMSQFNETLVTVGEVRSETDREHIRSAGVNLFVSVEDFLERLISFNVWFLKTDHFITGRFRFDPGVARRGIGDALGHELIDGENTFTWQRDGGNAIGTLMRYLDESVRWMESRLDAEKDSILRAESDLPFFADDPNRRFPFRHVEFWADADRSELSLFIERFRRIVKVLQQAQLAYVRNGLDHHRDESQFPNLNLLLACVARLREGVEAADIERYYPKFFWLQNRSESQHGWTLYEFADYKKRSIALYGPRMVVGVTPIVFNSPRIVAPGNLLGQPNASLLFSFEENTEYKEYWKGYPRRRKITAPSTGD